MPLVSSGQISLNDIHVEVGGTSGTECKMSDADIRGLGVLNANAQASFSHFYGRSNVLEAIISADATSVDISTLFTAAEWASSTPKKVTINSGIRLNSNSTSTAALLSGTGRGGTLEITNNGQIHGCGGVGSTYTAQSAGYDGGPAFNAEQSGITLINNGDIYGGGGGGGAGGGGGTGANTRVQNVYTYYTYKCYSCYNPLPDFYCDFYGYNDVLCANTSYSYSNYNGGAGGDGGQGGDGAGLSSLSTGEAGDAGSAGVYDSRAGTGGTGGTGGAGGNYGQAGSTGSTGATGGAIKQGTQTAAATAGTSGFAGGAAGASIVNTNNVTVTNNGNMN